MTSQTVFIVQTFIAGRGNALKADRRVICNTADGACRMAERLSGLKRGVVAFSTSGDAELGDFDDKPVMLFRAGQLPAEFED